MSKNKVFKRDLIWTVLKNGKTIFWLYPIWFWDGNIVLLEWDKIICDKICEFFKVSDWNIELNDNLLLINKVDNNIKINLIYKDNMIKKDFQQNLDVLKKIIK